MKKLLIILLVGVFIAGCSNDTTNEVEKKDEQEVDVTDTNKQNEDKENKEGNSEESSGANELGIEEADQPNLEIGDTAKVDTIDGIFELTLESVEIMEELDGESSQLDSIILLDIKLKNTSGENLEIKSLLSNFEVTDSLDGTGFPDGAEYFDSVEKMQGSIKSNEEVSGQFVTDIYDKNEYYFRLRSGYSGSGKSNNVVFTFKADEAK